MTSRHRSAATALVALGLAAGAAMPAAAQQGGGTQGGGTQGGGAQQEQARQQCFAVRFPAMTGSQNGQAGGGSGGGSIAQAPTFDQVCAPVAFQANEFEILTGQLAARRGRDERVRRFGRRLVIDHRRQQRALTQAATALGIQLPRTGSQGLNTQAGRELQRLRGTRARSRSFDLRFLRGQIAAHEMSISLHLTVVGTSAAPTLRLLAVGALPVLGMHLGAAEELLAAQGGSGSSGHH